MTHFLIKDGIVVALVCAGLAVLYGALTARYLLTKSPGNERMQEISKAVQEGATAYLRRQYTIIGGVAIVLAIILLVALNVRVAIGYQSTILTLLGVAVGIPAGIAVGRVVWRAVADGLGVEPRFAGSATMLVLVVVGAVLVANAVGALAAAAALRDRPATVLATE